MHFDRDRMAFFSGSSHPELSSLIASELGVELGKAKLETFPDGEISVQIQESVRGKETFVMQTIALRPNFYLMELLIMIDALKRASAKSIVVLLPYYGYCRQDRKDKSRVPITAKLVADLLEQAGATRVVTMDLHASQVQGFFNIPVDHLEAMPQMVQPFESLELKNLTVVTPDIGSVKLAREYASRLKKDFAIVDKRRLNEREVEVCTIIGEVEGRDLLLVDDICSTASTLISAAEALKKRGCGRVVAAVTHALMVEQALERLEESCIETILVSNTIPSAVWMGCPKVREVSVAPLFAEAIRRLMTGDSISSLFLPS